jgi:hypothetical protein
MDIVKLAEKAASERFHWAETNNVIKHGKTHVMKHLQFEVKNWSLDDINVSYGTNYTFSHGIDRVKSILNETDWGSDNTKLYLTVDNNKGRKFFPVKESDYATASWDLLKVNIKLHQMIQNKEEIQWFNNTNKIVKNDFVINSVKNNPTHNFLVELHKRNFYHNDYEMQQLLLQKLTGSKHLSYILSNSYKAIKMFVH